MDDLGKELRRLREAKGVDLDKVAAATKVGVHHLDALERGDLTALPGEVFVRGFIRAYAGFLGVESDRLVAMHRHEREGQDPDAVPARTVQEMSRLLAGAPVRVVRRARSGNQARRIGGLVSLAAGGAALLIFLVGRGVGVVVETAPQAQPLRASRIATAPAPASAPATKLPAPIPAPVPVAESKHEPADVAPREEGLEVVEHALGSFVERGRLEGRATSFEEGAAVFYWTRLAGGKAGQVVRHVWLHEDREAHSVELEVGGSQWRTWSRKTMRPGCAGHWSVEARDRYGRVLASDEFDCR